MLSEKELEEFELQKRHPMKIISWKIGDMKSTLQKGFLDWLSQEQPNILCLQDVGIDEKELSSGTKMPFPYWSYWTPILSVYTKEKPNKVYDKIGVEEFDDGSILILEFDNFDLINVKFPKRNLEKKKRMLKVFARFLKTFEDKQTIVCGNFNVARGMMDTYDLKGKEKTTMFTPEERKAMEKIVEKDEIIDTFRLFNKNTRGYNLLGSDEDREYNRGYRVDYIFVSENLVRTLKGEFILNDVTISRHCPVGVIMQL